VALADPRTQTQPETAIQPLRVLNVDVDAALAADWREWFCPAEQPFVVSVDHAARLGRHHEPDRLTPELSDTFFLWGPLQGTAMVWLSQDDVRRLSRDDRRELLGSQPAPHRWPSPQLHRQLVRWVEDGRRPSMHDRVTESQWRNAAAAGLGEARRLAGRFPASSGPNCFGTVMAATGVLDAADVWMQREPFVEWLATRTHRTGARRDDLPGTVLVWRSADGLVQHAALTIGGGWALHKPSQCWYSPTKILTVAGAMASARTSGWRVGRYELIG
jgi:hypothetical protein